MDAERFDALTRSLAMTGSRRRLHAATLGGVLGLLGLGRLETPGALALKKSKGKKGKKKKKGGKKGKKPECRNDADCPDQIESCQGGECQPVCPTGACAGCSFCFVTFASNGERVGVCANSLAGSSGVIDCATDANCPPQDPTCVAVSAALCDQPPCRQCFSADVCTP